MHNISVTINPKLIFFTFLAINLLLVLAYLSNFLFFSHSPIYTLDLDAETNLPTWYSSMLLFLVGLTAIGLYLNPPTRMGAKPLVFLLGGLSFLFLSLDEVALIHEKFNGLFFGSWIAIYGLIALMILWCVKKEICHIWGLNKKSVFLGILGLSFYVIAMSAEYIGYFIYGDIFWNNPNKSMGYTLEVCIEEFFELTGHSTILYGLLGLLPTSEAQT